jgi:hypothetical protein
MERSGFIGLVLLVAVACDEPTGPQPAQPIKAPAGYVPGGDPLTPKPPPGPPPRKAKVEGADDGGGAPAPAAAAAPAEEAKTVTPSVKCPNDVASVLTGKAKWQSKDKKKKHLEVRISGKSAAGELGIAFHQPVKAEDATVDDTELNPGELVVQLSPESPSAKVKLTMPVTCGMTDNQLLATVDVKGLSVQLREVPKPPEPGFLNVMGEAGLKVSAGGKELGVTPLRNVPMPPGKYQLTLKAAKGKPRTAAAEIKSGETSTVTLKGPK